MNARLQASHPLAMKQRIEVLQATKRKRRDSGHVSLSSLKEEKKMKCEHYISNSKME
jgi:hypothetical protein